MATVGLGDVYRYGARIVGYLLVVSVVAGVFLGGGAYLASRVMTLTDPSMSALSETQAFVGVFLMAVGALLGLIGFFGVAHKLLTESMERALAAHEADGVLTVADAEVAAHEEDETEADVTAATEPERASGGPEPAGSPGPGPDHEPLDGEPPTRQPTPPEPTPAGGETAPAGGEPAPVDEPEPVGAGHGPVDEPPVGGEPTPPAGAQDEPVDHTDSVDPVESVDSAEPADSAGPVEPGEPGEPAATIDDSPPEWTPPDPSEFETPDEEPIDDGSEDAIEDTETVIDAEPGDGPRSPEDIPDDVTLADEGVEGFQTGGEDDPLADRLPSDDE